MAAARALLLAVVGLAHVVSVEGVCLVLVRLRVPNRGMGETDEQAPLPPLHRLVSGLFTAVTCRLALGVMGYYWITTELVSSKKTSVDLSYSTRSAYKTDKAGTKTSHR